MTGVTVKFSSGLCVSDPVSTPVLVIGQPKDLAKVQWEDVKAKLEPRVAKEVGLSSAWFSLIAPLDDVADLGERGGLLFLVHLFVLVGPRSYIFVIPRN